MKKYLSISIASILALTAPGIAKAQLYVTADIGGVPTVSGATLENFDEPTPSILTLNSLSYLLTGDNYYSPLPIYCLSPYFSGSTAAFFGESPTYGSDSSQYVAVRIGGSATLSFPTPQHYLGLLWGTVGASDSLTFYDSANSVIGTVLGTDVPGAPLDSLNNPNDTLYVNITSATAFSRVVVTGNSFEFDDVASAQVVPEPASSVLFSAGLCILGLRSWLLELGVWSVRKRRGILNLGGRL